jgi:hypothetical protein
LRSEPDIEEMGSNLSNGLERKTVKASNANKTMFIKADEYF